MGINIMGINIMGINSVYLGEFWAILDGFRPRQKFPKMKSLKLIKLNRKSKICHGRSPSWSRRITLEPFLSSWACWSCFHKQTYGDQIPKPARLVLGSPPPPESEKSVICAANPLFLCVFWRRFAEKMLKMLCFCIENAHYWSPNTKIFILRGRLRRPHKKRKFF